MSSSTHCFVCDKRLQAKDFADFSKEVVVKVLSKVLGDGFFMVMKEEDQLCQSCANIVFRIPRLEAELRTATLGLRALLRIKYSLNFSHDKQETNSKESPSTPNTFRQKLEKLQSDISEFPQLTCKQETESNLENETFLASPAPVQSNLVNTSKKSHKPREPGSTNRTCHQEISSKTFTLSTKTNETKEVKEKSEEHNLDHTNVPEIEDPDSKTSSDYYDFDKVEGGSGGQDIYKCGMCSFKSTSTEELRNHFSNFKNKEGFYCKICDFSFHTKQNYKIHRANHTVNNQKKKCKVCGHQPIRDRLHLKFHIIKMHKKKNYLLL